jgi:hypothetical protein
MDEREAIQHELMQERRTTQRQKLLKRLRKLEDARQQKPVIAQTVPGAKMERQDSGNCWKNSPTVYKLPKDGSRAIIVSANAVCNYAWADGSFSRSLPEMPA